MSGPDTPSRRRWMAQALAALGTAAGAAALPTAGAQSAALAPANAAPARLVASFSILADMLRELAPATAEVSALVGRNADAHVYEPTPADARRLAQADLVLVNGLGFEGWIERLVRVSGFRGEPVVASRGVSPRPGTGEGAADAVPRSPSPARTHAHSHGHAHGGHGASDPHAWQDLAQARRYVANIAAALAARWPAWAAEVRTREADYLRRIDALDVQVRAWLAPVPRAQRRVISAHDAFAWFGAAYGVDFLAPRRWTSGSEPSAAAVAELIRQIRSQRVRALFLENTSDPRLIERIARETGARVGGTLYSDALSAVDGPAGTYLALVAHNARTVAAALTA